MSEEVAKPEVSILKRRAMVFLGEETIIQMLQLPATYKVMGVNAEFQRVGIAIMVTSPELEEVAPNIYPPQLQTELEWDNDCKTLRVRVIT